jgi:hypothetical protein
MAVREFKKVEQASYEGNKLQENVALFINQIKLVPFLSGNAVSDIVITTSGLTVAHELGRIPQGYFITAINANATVWQTQASDDRFLYLDASATVTISIWVY